LATDYLDLVYLDDNPQTPLESVIETIADEVRSGRVRALAVRNWSAERIVAANSQLCSHGLRGIAAIVTTELALASTTEALWPGYLPFDAELARITGTLRLAVFAHATDINLGQCLYDDAEATSRLRRGWVERWDHRRTERWSGECNTSQEYTGSRPAR
jgi:Aldo/keto reductase family